jgi:hypothetical protein
MDFAFLQCHVGRAAPAAGGSLAGRRAHQLLLPRYLAIALPARSPASRRRWPIPGPGPHGGTGRRRALWRRGGPAERRRPRGCAWRRAVAWPWAGRWP